MNGSAIVGSLISVNVGQPREIQWRGKTYRTSIWKTPVPGRVKVSRLNVAGDGQADLVGHGGEQRAVFVYQMDSYRHWATFLNRDDLAPGQFGENFTVEGLCDAEVCIGDRFSIGTAVFEVSAPRVTCFKVGIRMDRPDMPALLVSHRRPGFYFRVIDEGEVGAGDAIHQLSAGPQHMSVVEIDALLYSSHHPAEALRRAAVIPALSPGWQTSIKALLEASERGDQNGNAGLSPLAPSTLAWSGVRELVVTATEQASEEVRWFELTSRDSAALPGATPGQYLSLRVKPTEPDLPVVRNYSLCGPPAAGRYRIAVKKEAHGSASTYLHERVKQGDVLEVLAPRGEFTLKPGDGPLVLLSAGIGVTPVLAMLHASAGSARPLWWIQAARDRDHHPFKDEIAGLLRKTPQSMRRVIYSQPRACDLPGTDYDLGGHVDLQMLRSLDLPLTADFYICGPEAFITALRSSLTSLGVAVSRIHFELFGPSVKQTSAGQRIKPHLPAGAPQTSGPTVTFARSGLTVRWGSQYANLLELTEACEVPARWSCRSGICHSCESPLLEGAVDYSTIPLDPPGSGTVLICCSVPKGDIVLDL
jgi:ferredoxin-NADP reductase/MOSC domain-containing protein YiiM